MTILASFQGNGLRLKEVSNIYSVIYLQYLPKWGILANNIIDIFVETLRITNIVRGVFSRST